MNCNSKEVITTQTELTRRSEALKRKAVEKVDNTKYKSFQDTILSYKLFRYNEYKILSYMNMLVILIISGSCIFRQYLIFGALSFYDASYTHQ